MKKVIIAIIVIILIVLALMWFKNKSAEAPTNDTATGETGQVATTTGSSASLRDLVMSGKPQKCTFSDTRSGATTQGVVYVGGQKVRGDFTMTTGNQKTDGHMIMDGKTTFVWTSAMPQGVKFAMSADATTTAASQMSGQAIDYTSAMNYDCDSWTADASLFSVPTNITFMDLSTMMKPGVKTP